jgi:hypothetical protein
MLIIRLLAFAVTFYLMLEFIFVCKVDTKIASLLTFITMILVIIFFIVFKRYNLVQCGSCKQNISKSFFNSSTSATVGALATTTRL